MNSLFSRKRQADSDDEESLSNKKQFTGAPEETGDTASTNGTENEQETPSDQTKADQEETDSTDAPTEPAPEVRTVIPYSRLVILNLEVTCDENATNPAAVQVTKVLLKNNTVLINIMIYY